MFTLIMGLFLLVGIHSLALVAPSLRDRLASGIEQPTWKIGYSLVSVLGLALIVWGYGMAREAPVWLWVPSMWLNHLNALLMIPAFVLIAAAYVPGTHIRAKLGHPMLLGVKIWSFGHLLSNGTLADALLFGSFLIWSIAGFAIYRRRDRQLAIKRIAIGYQRDALAVSIGTACYLVFLVLLHEWLIGVAPFA